MEEEEQEIRGHSHFEQLRSILVHACALTDDLRRKHQILENLLVNISQSPATRPLLLHSRRACRLAQHPALCHKDNMTIRKFLLQLASKSREQISSLISRAAHRDMAALASQNKTHLA
jgi:hypothetical protein